MERLAATYHSVISLYLAWRIWRPPIRKKTDTAFNKNALAKKHGGDRMRNEKSDPEGEAGWEGAGDKVRVSFGIVSGKKKPIRNG